LAPTTWWARFPRARACSAAGSALPSDARSAACRLRGGRLGLHARRSASRGPPAAASGRPRRLWRASPLAGLLASGRPRRQLSPLAGLLASGRPRRLQLSPLAGLASGRPRRQLSPLAGLARRQCLQCCPPSPPPPICLQTQMTLGFSRDDAGEAQPPTAAAALDARAGDVSSSQSGWRLRCKRGLGRAPQSCPTCCRDSRAPSPASANDQPPCANLGVLPPHKHAC
jgi:hypothetical protein